MHRSGAMYSVPMLKGTREGIIVAIEPVAIHGQVSWDISFRDPDDPEGAVRKARVGPELVEGDPEPGDRVRIHYLVGSVTGVTKLET